ncbi:hypothetical protein AYO20_11590 [Fonsecaea nubica]|uniref:Xylanolytic transcriptional activator regulatory domain-containing protein n=1 Tax=Fonsecaea nubica TaxID=856822 RepID=A0A178BPX2_9EURO|nr:hypothetical protein AYO20_11590 [Fonsecaea nubica]OAL19718.1 hypothetical protein AYO20_11590 [Fonsecaea nubica]
MHDSKEVKKTFGGQALHDTDFSQVESTHEGEGYVAGELQQPSRTSMAPMLERSLPYHGIEGERWQLSQEHRLPDALSSTTDMPAASDFPLTAASGQSDNSQLGNFGVRYMVTSNPTRPAQPPGHTADAVHSFAQLNSAEQVHATDYPFLDTDFKSRIPPEDLDYLDCIGCLKLPQRTYLDDLLRAYFLYTHPHLPLINEGDFWDTYLHDRTDTQSPSRMSLLVFQAMLLVACSFVSSSTIQALGFSSVRAARASYYRRVKALYDFDIERSSLARAQGALLMTFHVPLNQPQINTYWLSVAIHLAKVAGADHFSTYAGRDPARHNQLKRVWWCCIIRDRTMALGLRRPINILSASFEEIWPLLTDHDLKSEIGRSCVRGTSAKLRLLHSLSALCKLCVVLCPILQLLYPSDGVRCDKDRLELLKGIYIYTEELNEWHDGVASSMRVHDPRDKSFNVVILFTNLLTIYFQSAKAALCNYRIMLTVNEPAEYNFERLQIKNELQVALRGIAQSLRAIIDADMITFSPISMVAFLALPSICYNLDLSNNATTQKAASTSGANIYQDFLRVLQLRYEGTDRALGNMSKLVNHMNLEDATSPMTVKSTSENHLAERSELDRSMEMADPAKRGAGIEIVISDPQKYLHMSNTLDFFLSRGRFPSNHDNSSNLVVSPADSDASPIPDRMNDSAAGDSSDATLRSLQTTSMADCVLATSSSGLNESVASRGAGSGNVELSVMLTDEPFASDAIHPYDFSFEDFMTDGPNSGIERLQNMLYAYPDWS